MTPWGTNVTYRLRGVNAAGNGAYSNERDVTTPPKPLLQITTQNASIRLACPAWATNYQLEFSTNLIQTTWSNVTAIKTNEGTWWSATVPASIDVRFYRLKL